MIFVTTFLRWEYMESTHMWSIFLMNGSTLAKPVEPQKPWREKEWDTGIKRCYDIDVLDRECYYKVAFHFWYYFSYAANVIDINVFNPYFMILAFLNSSWLIVIVDCYKAYLVFCVPIPFFFILHSDIIILSL